MARQKVICQDSSGCYFVGQWTGTWASLEDAWRAAWTQLNRVLARQVHNRSCYRLEGSA